MNISRMFAVLFCLTLSAFVWKIADDAGRKGNVTEIPIAHVKTDPLYRCVLMTSDNDEPDSRDPSNNLPTYLLNDEEKTDHGSNPNE